ncbi:TetR/AcrR family transcriptional regulator [Tissierella sp. Yu-01]|jgi:AcrR family transcriptional regulator|uniref:TetR/AcrR family transcriptional regulator n=1 Tax=Tissierella sp. Yu-01 TaxID=3035694 RepID=UPI00240DBE7C|nr:TetR/AcrR family transcriptional regulator [Tissierella sp. Yu-01]WFA08329.1 TetR/AcrR family transcriptional regulator [Tissierella sp. Yu-01]
MTKKEIHVRRMMSHFINVTDELINEIGIEKITIRKVAELAGFNSSTIYNYFENLDHLIFYAAMKNIKDYSLTLNYYLIGAENSMDRFLRVWECFCDYAYYKPEIYNAIFFPNLDKEMEDYVQDYYNLFHEDLGVHNDTISTMLLKRDIRERGMTTILDCIKEGYIDQDDGDKLNDMTLLIFEGMLKRVLMDKITYEDARCKTMDYIKSIVKLFLIKDYEFKY